MKIGIVNMQVPFIRGGAELLAEGLSTECRKRGFDTDIITLPFKWYPPEVLVKSMISAEMTDLTEVNGEKIDRLVMLKFPALYAPHPNKVTWLCHQHRQAYDLWNTRFGDLHTMPSGQNVKDLIWERDSHHLAQMKANFTISKKVSTRLKDYNKVDSTPLYHPPKNHEKYRTDAYENFIFYPSRIDPMKRQRLLVEAASLLSSDVQIKIAGTGSESELTYVRELVARLGLEKRVQLLGPISEEEKIALYARCRAVYFGAYDEDYGYITLEAMLARKPVIVHADAGGPLEFVEDGVSGFVIGPTARDLAEAIDQLGLQRDLPERLGDAALASLAAKNVSWDHVIDQLTRAY